ncbi:MAG TPA: 16S rRNA (cytidine(1402)-2'-O)-methyltransferase [Acidimicrobiia bacterium]
MTDMGTLYICATPIGNLGDTSTRLLNTLGSVDVVYAEDTRRTGILLDHFGISTRVRSLFAGNERVRTEQLVEDIEKGLDVALVSDAGMPSVSDPGALAASRVREVGGTVTVIPGPSAATTAVALAGFGGDRFVFEGFLPKKGREREIRIASVASDERQVVLFVSPHRLRDDLESLALAVGPDRRVAICRELTKVHEEAWVGSLEEGIAEWAEREPMGEYTLVLAPVSPEVPDLADAVSRARLLIEAGASVSEAARDIATETGVSRRPIYQKLLDDQELS